MSGKEKGVNVQVLLRCRPFSDDELRSNAPQVVTCNDYSREVAVSQNIAGKHIDRVFTFDKVFGPSAQQRELYEQAVTPIVNEVLEGFNCTIFAYGQTGTGKTFTMEGECKRSKSGPNGELPPEAGVIPRAVKQIFDTLEGQNAEYSVKVTFLELYNEEITDLLAPEEISKVSLEEKQKKQLPLMEDGKGGVLVRGLEEEIVTCASEIYTLLERGSSKRRTAETLLNKQSSRSHSLFSITIHIKEATPEGEELIKCGKLNLVDLAGSENISRSGAREAAIDLKEKMKDLRAVYVSHIEAVQNVVRLHKASSDASLEELSSAISSHGHSIEEFLTTAATEAGSIFDELQSCLSTQHGELTLFAREVRNRFNLSVEQIKEISERSEELVEKLFEESKNLEEFVARADQMQTESIDDFKKAYEEQSKSESEKLIADMTSLISDHIRRQVHLVDSKLVDLRESGIKNKSFFDGHVSSVEDITTNAKRKWQSFCIQAEKDAKDTADYSAAKHCRMEVLLQQSVSTAHLAFGQVKRTHEAVNELGAKHIFATESLIRNACESHVQHVAEVNSARAAAEEDVAKNTDDFLQQFDATSAEERESVCSVVNVVKSHANTLEMFRENHSGQAASIEHRACETFQQNYMDYEPSGTTPVRCEPEVPSKGTIDSLRTLPIEALLEEFRENNSYESSSDVKELKPSLIPRSPLTQLN